MILLNYPVAVVLSLILQATFLKPQEPGEEPAPEPDSGALRVDAAAPAERKPRRNGRWPTFEQISLIAVKR